MENEVVHNETKKRFELTRHGQIAVLEYSPFGTGLILAHTEVPKELEGQGIASALAKFALEYAAANHKKIVPVCPFVKAYLLRHPEYEDLVLVQKERS